MRNRRRKKRSHPFARAWRETELDDAGEPLADLPPVRCPRCCRLIDLGGLDDTDVHRCGFCQTRTRWLWSDLRQIAVAQIRGPNPDWWVESWDELYRGYDSEDHDYDCDSNEMYAGVRCVNDCEDPVFGGPAAEVQVRGEWVCAVCGHGEGDSDEGDEDDGDEGDEDFGDDAE